MSCAPTLDHARFEAKAIVSGVPAAALSCYNSSGKLVDAFERVATAAAERDGCGDGGCRNYPGDSRFRCSTTWIDIDFVVACF